MIRKTEGNDVRKPQAQARPAQASSPARKPQADTGASRPEQDRDDSYEPDDRDDDEVRQQQDQAALRQMAMRKPGLAQQAVQLALPGSVRNDLVQNAIQGQPNPQNPAPQVAGAVAGQFVGNAVTGVVDDLVGDTFGEAVGAGVSQGIGGAVTGFVQGGDPSFTGAAASGLATGVGLGVGVTASSVVGGLVGQAAGEVLGDQQGAVLGAGVTNGLGQSLGNSLTTSVSSGSVNLTSVANNALGATASGLAGGAGALVGMQAGQVVTGALDGVVGAEAAGLGGLATTGAVGAASTSLLTGGGLAVAGTAGLVGGGAALAPVVALNSLTGAQALFSDDRDLTFTEQASLALPTFGLSFLANPIKDLFGGGKDPEQQQRDQLRGFLRDGGFADRDYRIRLADGTGFDIGAETVRDAQGNATGRIYELPWDQEATPRTVALAQSVAATLVGEEEFYTGSLTMTLTNAALSNADGDPAAARSNMRQFVKDLGLTPGTMVDRILTLRDQGRIDDQRTEVYLQGVRDLFLDNPERDRQPLSPSAFPSFARPTLRGYTQEQLLTAGWEPATLAQMQAEGRLELAA